MPADRQLIQVVPRLWPTRCGVSDHAIALAAELKTGCGIDSSFIVLNSGERPDLPYRVTHCPQDRLLEACVALSGDQPAAILVHLSGYGYSADGAPTILAAALERVKADGRFPIAVFFHELHASGMPWTSAFWYGQRQKRAYRRIARACDLPVTSARVFAGWIERQTATPVQCMPVFSQIGETEQPLPFAGREPAMAIFGLAGTRKRVYPELDKLGDTFQKLGIRKIVDIGPPIATPRHVNGIQLECVGALPTAEIDRLLAHTAFGYLAYPPNCLAKSGVFAAYTAHGIIPVIAQGFREEFDGLKDGVHVLSPQTARRMSPENLEDCSQSAWRWYSGHTLRDHAAIYGRWLQQAAPDKEKIVEREHA
ncbi:MAG: hypothetical protein WBP85_18290 [Terracidiphilus sp.]